MAFNKVFIILALVSSALAMPVHLVDQTTQTVEAETTSASIDIKIEDSTTVQGSITTTATADEDEPSATEPTMKNIVDEGKDVDQDVVKRSIEEKSSADADADDMETAAGTNVLRPLFVYRQQVAYRQRIRNANRQGNRRF